MNYRYTPEEIGDLNAEIARLRAEVIGVKADLHNMTGFRDGLAKIAAELEADRDRLAAKVERLTAARDALAELHTLIDFDTPLTDQSPWLFEDATDINAAFEKAYAAVCLNRIVEQSQPEGKE